MTLPENLPHPRLSFISDDLYFDNSPPHRKAVPPTGVLPVLPMCPCCMLIVDACMQGMIPLAAAWMAPALASFILWSCRHIPCTFISRQYCQRSIPAIDVSLLFIPRMLHDSNVHAECRESWVPCIALMISSPAWRSLRMRTSMHCCMLCQLESWLRFSVRDMSNSACFLISLISPPFRSLRLPLLVTVITCPVFKPGVYYEKRERGGAGGRGNKREPPVTFAGTCLRARSLKTKKSSTSTTSTQLPSRLHLSSIHTDSSLA